jgi:hypothetical protein
MAFTRASQGLYPSKINPVHTLLPFMCKIHFNITLHLCISHPNDFFPSGVHIKILHAFHISLMHTTFPAQHILIVLIVLLIYGAEHIILKLLVQFSPVSCHSSLLGPIHLSTLLWNTLHFYSSLMTKVGKALGKLIFRRPKMMTR